MDDSRIDPSSPVPLYHQIAEAIRARIERGELRPGDVLEPMRQAATCWGVNLHTVRHAYVALAREGLLEMRAARGTRVTRKGWEIAHQAPPATAAGDENAAPSGRAEDLEAFLARMVRTANDRYGLGAEDLAARLRDVAPVALSAQPVVWVVECSDWQCEAHAAEISRRWHVDARAWPLYNDPPPEGGVIVATYFHYNDIRRRWPRLLSCVRFLTIRVSDELVAWLEGVSSVLLVEADGPTADAVAADVRVTAARDLEISLIVTDDPSGAIPDRDDARILFSPRVWSRVRERVERDPRCAVVPYTFDAAELEAAARDCGWIPKRQKGDP